jgi:hypothetical protein
MNLAMMILKRKHPMFGKLEKELERDFKKNHLKRIKAVIAKKKKVGSKIYQ